MGDEGQELARSLPSYFPIDSDSNNYKLLEPVGKAVGRADDSIESLDNNANVQTADSIDNLFELAKLVDLPPKTGESLEEYSSKVISEFQLNSSSGTIEDLIFNSAVMLNVRPETITYRASPEENGLGFLGVPRQGLMSLDISEQEFSEIVQKNAAAGYRVEAFQLGTFQYITPDEYDYEDHSLDLGYDGLDADGIPTGEGGTYAGLLE